MNIFYIFNLIDFSLRIILRVNFFDLYKNTENGCKSAEINNIFKI